MNLIAAGELGTSSERCVIRMGQDAATDLDFEWNATKRGICTLLSRYVWQQYTRLHYIISNRAELCRHPGHSIVTVARLTLVTATSFF